MANSEDTIDPNDLDSIDALLDEAEWNTDDLEDATSDLPDVAEEQSEEPATEAPEQAEESASVADDSDDLENLDETDDTSESAEQDQVEDALSELEDLPDEATETEQEAEPEAEEEQANDDPPAEEDKVDTSLPEAGKPKSNTQQLQDTEPEASEKDDQLEKKLEQRKKSQKHNTNELTVAEMDTLKKLIIIFGSISIVLLLTAIGIATWGALSASSAGISEENQTLIESIKVNSDLSNEIAKANTEAADSLEKKIDAVNFQIEQLAVDLTDLANSAPSVPSKQPKIDPLGLNQMEQKTKPAPVQKVEAPQQVAVKINSEITKKVSSVNYKLIKAQKTINELSQRLKALQSHQQKMLKSVKTVEKEMLQQKAEKLKAQKAAEKKQNSRDAYQYGPNDVFYDQGGSGSYP